MKTQNLFRTLMLIVVFTTSTVMAMAKTNSQHGMNIDSNAALKQIISTLIEKDFAAHDSFIFGSRISSLNENVELQFYIDSKNRVKVVSVKCENERTAKYIEALLNDQIVNVDKSMNDKIFMIGLKLVYRS